MSTLLFQSPGTLFRPPPLALPHHSHVHVEEHVAGGLALPFDTLLAGVHHRVVREREPTLVLLVVHVSDVVT
jgi:hypothetical protein